MAERAVILLAEDNEDHVMLIRSALKQAGLLNPLHVVHDGEEVIQYLSGEGPYEHRAEYPLPSILLLDLNMPRKNGLEVLEWIGSHPESKPFRVVVLTTSSDLRSVNRAYQLGASSFLIKPTDFESVTNLLQQFKAPDTNRTAIEAVAAPLAAALNK